MSVRTTIPVTWHLTGRHALVQGSNWRRYRALVYRDLAGVEHVWDTAGWTARMQIRADKEGPTLFELTTENGRLLTGVTGFTVILALDATSLVGVADWGLGYYDLELISPFDQVYQIYEGRAAMRRNVTR